MKKINTEQRSDEWFYNRKGKITGTMLKSIMGSDKVRQDALYEYIADRLTLGNPEAEEYENAMDRGNRLEPDAIAMFELETGKKVERVGMFVKGDDDRIANSPDGNVMDTDDSEGVEAKCMGGKNHVKFWLTNKLPDEYEWQVAQYFIVNPKLNKLWFIGFNPDIAIHPLHILEITRESIEFNIALAEAKQVAFLNEAEALLSTLIKL